jgi:outer membrane protein, heavy metal efflux system
MLSLQSAEERPGNGALERNRAGETAMKRYWAALAVGAALITSFVSATIAEEAAAPTPVASGMTLADFLRLAEQNNPTLMQAAARVQVARAVLERAGRYPNPRAGYLASEIGDEGRAGQQGGYIGQEVVLGGKLQYDREMAEHAVQEAEYAWAAQRARVSNDVQRAFYEVLIAQRTIDTANQLLQIAEEGIRASDALYKAKEINRSDVLQMQIEAENTRIFDEKAKNRHVSAWRNLSVVLGMPELPGTALIGDLEGDLPQETWDAALQRLLSESPAIAQAQSAVARAEANVRRQQAERIPNIDLTVNMQYDNATQDTIAGIQAGVPLPLFRTNRANMDRASAELAVARNEAKRVSLEMQQRLAATFEQYQNAKFQVEKYSTVILPNAKKSLDLATQGHQQGEINYTMLLLARRTYFQTNLSYIEAIRELRAATIAIEGNLLGDSLQQRQGD